MGNSIWGITLSVHVFSRPWKPWMPSRCAGITELGGLRSVRDDPVEKLHMLFENGPDTIRAFLQLRSTVKIVHVLHMRYS